MSTETNTTARRPRAGERTNARVVVAAWTTAVPGLVVTPAIGTTGFVLTHEASGRCVPYLFDDRADAQAAARRIRKLGLDFTVEIPLYTDERAAILAACEPRV